jgi:tRNA-specific 2-thiouridylase
MNQSIRKPVNQKTRICVGLSGGVDSSVTAALLKEQGFEVIGVYMKNWNIDSPTLGSRPLDKDEYRMECPWYDDYLDAKRVALQLEIPFYLWDFREAYKKKVFDHFVDEFEKGRTPNPDIYCNSLIKFDDFQQKAIAELGVDAVATGHYARLIEEDGKFALQIPKDTHKDQTYFLYRLNQEQLSRAMFPLAEYTKDEVRELAKKFNLPTKYKKDSQGICFVGDVEMRDFITHWLAPKDGEILDETGAVIGRHDGAHIYTIGEKIAVDNASIARLYPEMKHEIPYFYVAKKDMATNSIIAVPGADHPLLFTKEISLESPIFSPIIEPTRQCYTALCSRVRHGGELVGCTFAGEKVVFDKPVRAVAPGQHLVLYDSQNRVVGGGVIAATA